MGKWVRKIAKSKKIGALRRAGLLVSMRTLKVLKSNLASESVQGAALTLESIDNIHSCHGLALGMLGVGDGITDNVLEENLEDTTSLLVDQAGDTLDSTTAGETTDGGLGDTLDVITQDLAMPLGSALSESFTSLSSSRHGDVD